MKLKLPKIKIPTIITRRESNGAVEIFGMTGGELAISTGAVCGLYVFLAGFFTILLVISQAIRNNGDFYVVPGTEKLEGDSHEDE